MSDCVCMCISMRTPLHFLLHVCISGSELKGYVVSNLEPDGSFVLLLTDEEHSDDIYKNLQPIIE